MNLGIFFWIVYVVCFLISLFLTNQVPERAGWPAWTRNSLIFFILIGLLGWAQFGAVVHK